MRPLPTPLSRVPPLRSMQLESPENVADSVAFTVTSPPEPALEVLRILPPPVTVRRSTLTTISPPRPAVERLDERVLEVTLPVSPRVKDPAEMVTGPPLPVP